MDYATKASIVAFTKALSKHMMKRGVGVNAVRRPGQAVEIAPIYVLLVFIGIGLVMASQEIKFVTGEGSRRHRRKQRNLSWYKAFAQKHIA